MSQIGGGGNVHARLQEVVELVIKESRALRVQPFNEYRKKFELKPYTSFYEFTGKHYWCFQKYALCAKIHTKACFWPRLARDVPSFHMDVLIIFYSTDQCWCIYDNAGGNLIDDC